MKKAYFVNYYRNFGNTYELRWVWADEIDEMPEHWQRITRKRAIQLCISERQARREDPAFSGYADIHIWPMWNGGYGRGEWICDNGYIMEWWEK